MKTLIILGLALAGVTNLGAQTYIRTNMNVAATITNSSTYTYGGTNLVDATRYGEVGFVASNTGNAAATNYVTWTFQISADGTNWATAPVYTWLTGPGVTVTNWNLGTVGYIRPYQRVSTNSEPLTNSLFGLLKGYRRD